MIEQIAITAIERSPTAAPQIVGGGRQIVGTQHLAHSAQLPPGALPSRRGRFEAFARRNHLPAPAAIRKRQLKQQVRERLAPDGHTQIVAISKIEGCLVSWWMLLGKVNFLFRSVQRAIRASGAAACASGALKTIRDDAVQARSAACALPAIVVHPSPIAARSRFRTPRQTDRAEFASCAACGPSRDMSLSANYARCARSCRLPLPPLPASCLPSASSATP